jgi:Ca-activated chloride channel family protein
MSARYGLSILVSSLAVMMSAAPSLRAQDGQAPASAPTLTFRSSVNVVSVAAVVRDKRGKVMPSLKGEDFVVLDGGRRKELVDFQNTTTAPASVALLIDGSGSMRLGAAQESARQISREILKTLDPSRDTAALYSFDTRLLTLCEFTGDFEAIRAGLWDVEAFGSTSLYDAIAGTSGKVAAKAQSRRAVIVLTDGVDTTSEYPADTVAWIASSIDVPVYVFAVGDGLAQGLHDEKREAGHSGLAALARATGGDLFIANTPESIAAAVKLVADELRHQYVLAFEAASDPGMRRLEVRVRRPELRVKSRNWYQGLE